ncbi:hypothetical protein [Pseudoneobacillus sp. C159]
MEKKWVEKPRDFGEILDLTFLVLRKQFSKIFLIMLILIGPVLLVQMVAMLSGGIPFLPGGGGREGLSTLDRLLNGISSTGFENILLNLGGIELVILIITLALLGLVLLPTALAATAILTKRVKDEAPIDIGSIIKEAFSRYWALIGGSIVYFLIVLGLIIVPTLGITFLFAFGQPNVGAGLIVGTVLFGLAYICGLIYLFTRWGFYFVAIVFENVSPGLSRSWQLTRGHFWRLVGLYIILNIIISIITYALEIVSSLLLANSIIGTLFYTLVTGLTYIIMNIAYAVIYFDLRVRNEGTDLEEMLDNYYSTNDGSQTHRDHHPTGKIATNEDVVSAEELEMVSKEYPPEPPRETNPESKETEK